jgi:hypothetical protein
MKNLLLSILFLASLLFGGSATAQNLALNKPAIASSATRSASQAFDNNGDTRWESAISDVQYIIVDLGSVQTIDRIRLSWENAYGKDFTLDVSTVTDNPVGTAWTNVVDGNWTNMKNIMGNKTTANEFANLGQRGRYVRMRGTARATTYGYSLFEFEIYNYSNSSVGNLAINKPSSSSADQGGFPAAQAFDNNGDTRWGSPYSDNQWVYVDLRNTVNISRVSLVWEVGYGTNYRIEVGTTTDANGVVNDWKTVDTKTGNKLYFNDINFLPAVTGRYVRMYGVTRGTSYGFSLYEFQVYGTIVAPLPVSLVGFTATPQASGVALKWYTATELNNAGFEVQRSANGTEFTTIAKVEGAGNSQTLKTYSYLDAAPLASTGYYRLRQLDQDGTATYGPMVAVQPTRRALASFSLYPNPTADQATVQWEASGAGAGQWQLTSTAGQLLHQASFEMQPGANAQTIDLRAYAAGSYVLTVQVAGQAPHRQLIQKVQ